MPIRFRCVYCKRLLGIARRKAGQVVRCPHCSEQLIVPTPTDDQLPDDRDGPDNVSTTAQLPGSGSGKVAVAPAPAKPSGPQKLFERSDFDELLGKQNGPAQPVPPGPGQAGRRVGVDNQTVDSAPVPKAPPVTSAMMDAVPISGIVLSPVTATILAVLIIVLMSASFAGGLIVGRLLPTPSAVSPAKTP